MKLLILFGPPAVGKTTVGRLLESRTDYKLFHNHMIMDGIMHIFGVGSPAEDRLSRSIRTEVITEAADAGIDLIFTYYWNFSRDKGKANIDAYKKIYEERGGEVLFVELVAPIDVLVERAAHPDRHHQKQHAADAAEIARIDQRKFVSPVPFFYPDLYRQIDTTGKTSEQVAQEIMAWDHFRTN